LISYFLLAQTESSRLYGVEQRKDHVLSLC